MLYSLDNRSRKQFVKKYAGGKGYNLFLLSNNGFCVPEYKILGYHAFLDYMKGNAISSTIDKIISNLDSYLTMEKGEEVHNQIETLFLNGKFSPELESIIEKLFIEFGQQNISIRSSAAGEDSAAHSFAGQLSSYLFINDLNEAKYAIKKCWASGFTARSLAYRLQKGINISDTRVSVILQKMIDPDVSGVIFSQNLIESKPAEIIISAVYGVGEGLVSGSLDADTFYIHRINKQIRSEIAKKRSRFIQDSNNPGHCIEKENALDIHDKACLSDEAIQALTDLSIQIEDFFNFPQDIEFAVKNNQIYILQARPVTATEKQSLFFKGRQAFLWDNSNIIESYPGVTTPLTFSFASHAYYKAYKQMAVFGGIDDATLTENEQTFRNMIGIIDGRIYCGLTNWYKLLSLIPGFKGNKSFMETMMGVSETLPPDIAETLKTGEIKLTLKDRFAKLRAGYQVMNVNFTIKRRVKLFFERFWEIFNSYSGMDYSRLNTDDTLRYFQEYNNQMLENWKTPLANDFLLMLYFGILKKLTEKWCSELGDRLYNDLISGEGGLESAEPTHKIISLTAMVKKDPVLNEMFTSLEPENIFELIHRKPEFKSFNAEIEAYIQQFGFRCMSEQKLEEVDLWTDPGYLFIMIKNYLRAGKYNIEEFLKDEKKLRIEAQAKIDKHLKGSKKKIFYWILKNARLAVKNRENMRFARTRYFGLVRRMFIGVGDDLTCKGILDQQMDVFYLTVEELIAFSEGRSYHRNLKPLVNIRKKEYEAYIKNDEPSERFYTRGLVYIGNNWQQNAFLPEEDLPEGTLKGLPCSQGTVEGKVKIILSPGDNLELNGEILVTSRTDPGWVPIYPSISGLAIERGSLLSHSAIVARELGIPTVIKVRGLLDKVKSGVLLHLDGSKGVLKILSQE
ncbi:pyruvate water dikinase [Candidatus Magnetomorum sp. HK-1]|nr:pyruvate water dikinase [Candidatus Magnetomorum sp. HK-1]